MDNLKDTIQERIVLEVKDAYKSFGFVKALSGVNFKLYKGEIVALLGDNGAGKSTLVKILSGVYPLDEGKILLDGKPVTLASSGDARRSGIETVFQDLAVFDNLDVAANFAIGREKPVPAWLGPFGYISPKKQAQEWKQYAGTLGLSVLNPNQEIGLMSGGQRQLVAVARAVAYAKKVIILDEPTAALGVRESKQVLDLIKKLPELGLSVIIISHNMEHVVQVADRAVVLRQGRNAGEAPAKQQNTVELVRLIMGADAERVEGAN